MLKPSDKWNWYYDELKACLMLDLGDMIFQTNLSRRLLVNSAFGDNEFSVDDAIAFQTYKERIQLLDMNAYRHTELTLYCVATKRFHKPVQPKSWFFNLSPSEFVPEEGDMVSLHNDNSKGMFIVVEVGDCSSLCCYVGHDMFNLTSTKSLKFGEPIKVMHDRMESANNQFTSSFIALVS